MKQKYKELLLTDLCARLPYMPKVKITYQQQGVKGTDEGNASCDFIEKIVNDLRNGVITDMQIYLRPTSSMTEEEEKEYKHLVAFSGSPNGAANFVDWLNKKMFAYRTIDGKDMFELGIALKAPEGMYK